MNRWIGLVAAVALLAGCDSQAPDADVATPQVSFKYIYADGSDAPSPIGKSSAIWNVSLSLVGLDGTDYSPADQTVDDATSQQAVFNVSIPADAVYRVTATLSQGGVERAEGGVISLVDNSDSELIVPVMVGSNGVPMVGFIPSVVDAPASRLGSSVSARVKFFGAGTNAVGVAAELEAAGVSPNDITVDGATIRRNETGRLDLFWNLQTQQSAPTNLADLEIPVDADGACLSISAGDARSVTSDGSISRQQAVTSFCLNRSL